MISLILIITFISLSALHFYWVCGGTWGTDVVFPTKGENDPPIMPGKIITCIVALGLCCIGLFYIIKADFLPIKLPLELDKYGLGILAFIFIARAIGDFRYIGFFKKIKSTRFAANDTKYYSPISLIIGILTIMIA